MSTPLSLLLRAVALWLAWPWLAANGLQWPAVLLLAAALFDEIAPHLPGSRS